VRIIHTIADMRLALAAHRDISLVPTMGNLHDGHLSLVSAARQAGGVVVVSIFVNQLQFAPNEDFDKYPRTLERDCELLAAAGCEIVFAPSAKDMYPEPQQCLVHPPAALADVLEGAVRPGFFVGVSTVVLKLFDIVRPSFAVFGKKDYQQLLVIKNMVRQFALPIEIIPAETVRESNGIALSSRNGYLDHSQRIEAVHLYNTLRKAADQVQSGRIERQQIERAAAESLTARGWQPDYVAIRRRSDLGIPSSADSLVILGAARLGNTRLIDNWEI
jgi:pantoate--beta-alanine ligase